MEKNIFLGHGHGIQGLNPYHSSDVTHGSDNTKPLITRPPGKSKRIVFFTLIYRIEISQPLCRSQEQSTGISRGALQGKKLGHRKAFFFLKSMNNIPTCLMWRLLCHCLYSASFSVFLYSLQTKKYVLKLPTHIYTHF